MAHTFAEARALAAEARAALYEAQAEVARLSPHAPSDHARQVEVGEWTKLATSAWTEAQKWWHTLRAETSSRTEARS